MEPGNRLRIYFDGAARDVERAFSVSIGIYEYRSKTYYSNEADPVIPLGLQNKAHGVYGLDNFPKVHPMYKMGSGVALAPQDMHVAYNLSPLDLSGIDGSGQSIAVVETLRHSPALRSLYRWMALHRIRERFLRDLPQARNAR
jgi:subtilase family serine protease